MCRGATRSAVARRRGRRGACTCTCTCALPGGGQCAARRRALGSLGGTRKLEVDGVVGAKCGEDVLLGWLRRPNGLQSRHLVLRTNRKLDGLRPARNRGVEPRGAVGSAADGGAAAVRPRALTRVRGCGKLARRGLGGLRRAVVGCGVLLIILAHLIIEVSEPVGVVLAAMLPDACGKGRGDQKPWRGDGHDGRTACDQGLA